MAGSLVLSLSESGPGLATTRIGRCCLLRGATDLQSSAIKWGSKAKGRVVVLKRNVWKLWVVVGRVVVAHTLTLYSKLSSTGPGTQTQNKNNAKLVFTTFI
jgi:hypothetical protein